MKEFSFELITSDRSYLLSASNFKEMKEWTQLWKEFSQTNFDLTDRPQLVQSKSQTDLSRRNSLYEKKDSSTNIQDERRRSATMSEKRSSQFEKKDSFANIQNEKRDSLRNSALNDINETNTTELEDPASISSEFTGQSKFQEEPQKNISDTESRYFKKFGLKVPDYVDDPNEEEFQADEPLMASQKMIIKKKKKKACCECNLV